VAQVAVIGAGHVGVVYAAGLADLGHQVRVVDIDRAKVARLRRGDVWFHEPGLADLLARAIRKGRVTFTTSYPAGIAGAEFLFVCVPTPTSPDGNLDDSALRNAYDTIRRLAADPKPIVVNKSTVPVGTSEWARVLFADAGLPVVSNPEFLAEGRALEDFYRPSRIVLGARDRSAAEAVASLYRGLRAPIVYTDNATAEFSKLAANAFLAMKVSFANALARLCESVGADAEALTETLSLDPRIGQGHLRAGLGFGGSCFPKDVAAVEHLARKHDANPDLFGAVLRVNQQQRTRVVDHLVARLDSLERRRIAVLGLAFKAGTDDTRESPSVALVEELLALHADVVVYDPVVRTELKNGAARAASARTPLAAARRADAVIVATEWPELASLDLVRLRTAMRGDVLVDGRGIISPEAARAAGFDYFGFGRGGTENGNGASLPRPRRA
jgi:UDPglucose 6-dehydrogenase